MKKLKLLLSTKVSLVLIIIFAVSMGAATFIENDYGTAIAREAVYEAWWFEVILIWLAINFLSHIQKYKLFTAKRWPLGVFHIAFVLMILGAGVTRYFGKEGVIHIREGEVKHSYFSAEHFLQIAEAGKNTNLRYERPLSLSSYQFEPQTLVADMGDRSFKVSIEEYLKGAHKEYAPGKDTLIDLALAFGGEREDHLITRGDDLPMGNMALSTSREGQGDIKIYKEDSLWMVQSRKDMQIVEMSTQKMGMLRAGEPLPLQVRSLYQVDSVAFLIKAIYEGKKIVYHSGDHGGMGADQIDVVKLKVTDAEGNELLSTYNPLVSKDPQKHVFFVNNSKYILSYGPREEILPFALQLRAFELERYPGSESPSSYASEVQVIDHGGSNFTYRIYMNNVLDHKGFRFYQASYDTDEKGTILSVSQDRPGTYITYFSYTLLSIGMFFTFFVKGSRFSILNRRLKVQSKGNVKKTAAGKSRPAATDSESETPKVLIPKTTLFTILVLLVFLFMGIKAFSQDELPDVRHTVVPLEHAEAYGSLVVQDLDGRMKPLNTLANEITRKLSGRSTITITQTEENIELTAEQFLLAIQLDPAAYSSLPLIKVDPDKGGIIFKT